MQLLGADYLEKISASLRIVDIRPVATERHSGSVPP